MGANAPIQARLGLRPPVARARLAFQSAFRPAFEGWAIRRLKGGGAVVLGHSRARKSVFAKFAVQSFWRSLADNRVPKNSSTAKAASRLRQGRQVDDGAAKVLRSFLVVRADAGRLEWTQPQAEGGVA